MRRRLWKRLTGRLAGERGFTLIEVLVAMVAGIIVTGALFAILEVSLKQNARITDRVQAQQLGSTAMTRIIDPLRSGCFSREAAPVQAGSTGNKLIFTTAFSEATTPANSEVFKQIVNYESHKLTINSKKATGGSWPTYTSWEEPGKTTTIAENVYMASPRTAPFTYYKYGKESKSTTETGVSAMEKVEPPAEGLSSATAKQVAGVEVGFEALPTNNDSRLNRGAQFSDQVTFAFSSPDSEGTITAGPCE